MERAKWVSQNKIRLRFDPFAYRYIRLKVLARDQYVCYWCGGPGDTIDHVIPWSKGGRTTMNNCICACSECNGERGDMPSEEFARIKKVPAPRDGLLPIPAAARAGAPTTLRPVPTPTGKSAATAEPAPTAPPVTRRSHRLVYQLLDPTLQPVRPSTLR